MGAVVTLTTTALLVMGTGAANAADNPDPVGDLLGKVTKTVEGTAHQAKANTATRPSQDAPNPPASDSDSPGHETANPKAPDHASSQLAHADVGGQDLATLGSGNSTANDDDSTTADSTLLAIGGQEIIGSHASSDGTTEESPVPAIPVCSSSNGAVCLDLLYSQSTASESASTSQAQTDNGVGSVCLGGTDPKATPETCKGPIEAGLLYGHSEIQRDRASGRTQGSSDSQVTSACLNRDPVLGTCTVSVGLLNSYGRADSNGSADRGSNVADLALNPPAGGPALPGLPGLPGNPPVPDGSQPFAISVPTPECASPNLLCIFGNQGETYLGNGVAGTAQDALLVSALEKNLNLNAAHSETLVHNTGGHQVIPPSPPKHQPTTTAKSVKKATTVAAKLPFTGGAWSGLLAIALGLFALGAIATAWDRRRVLA